jgi:hypothetical protein
MSSLWHFSQAWLSKSELGFRPGVAQIEWDRGQLRLLVEMSDDEVGTTASANQQRLWEHGDVLEFFIQRFGNEDYYEYQISPNSFTLALHYPDTTSVTAMRNGSRTLEEFFTDKPLEARAVMTPTGWNAMLCIPLPARRGDIIRVSCSRYDYGTGRSPILSSTSPHPILDFHRSQDWREIVLMEE